MVLLVLTRMSLVIITRLLLNDVNKILNNIYIMFWLNFKYGDSIDVNMFCKSLIYVFCIDKFGSMKCNDGSAVASEHEQADIWVQHFCEVLNRPQPHEPAELSRTPDDHNIDTRSGIQNRHRRYEELKSPRHRLHPC